MKIIECPRDAMQGIKDFIPTEQKASYINSLLKVGFDTIDFGSFVSPKAIPQLKDTAEVLEKLDLSETDSKLLAIVANTRGAKDAAEFDEINYLGFPFSVSETFQKRNTNKSIAESLEEVEVIKNICATRGKDLVVYLSMGFGNPYGDFWHEDIVASWADQIHGLDIETISIADTTGVATPKSIKRVFDTVMEEFPNAEFGIHLHTTAQNWLENTSAAFESGVDRFDGAIKGIGGCPFAEDELVGNLATENLISYLKKKKIDMKIDEEAFNLAMIEAEKTFGNT